MSQVSTKDRAIRKLTLRQADWPDEMDWTAKAEYEDGCTVVIHASSVYQLLAQLPPFDAECWAAETRVTVERGARCSRTDLLELIQFNNGGNGLDISGCLFMNCDLTGEAVSGFRKRFMEQRGYDPVWWNSDGRLNANSIAANDAIFSRCRLDSASFRGAKLNRADFESCSLVGVDLERAQIEGALFGGSDLSDARLSHVCAKGAQFTVFSSPARMDGASVFRGDFEGAVFSGVHLDRIRGLDKGTNFARARLWGVKLDGANLALLTPGALAGAYLLDAVLDRTQVRREHFGEAVGEEIEANSGLVNSFELTTGLPVPVAELYNRASETYRSLKVNFVSIGRTEDASWAHFKQREMYRKYLRQDYRNSRSSCIALRLGMDCIVLWTSGYGERPWQPVALGGAAIFCFAAIYRVIGVHTGDEFTFAESLIYSGASFFSMSFSALEPMSWITQALTVSEAALGILIFGLFLWTIANKVGRS